MSPERLMSWMVTIPGWFSADAARASCRKRRLRSSLPVRADGSVLIATSRPSCVSRALYTSPMPPAPRGERISYAPSCEPGSRGIAESLDEHQIRAELVACFFKNRLTVRRNHQSHGVGGRFQLDGSAQIEQSRHILVALTAAYGWQ